MDTMKRTPPGRGDDERGAGVVEFALILPLLMMLVFGTIQFGLLYNRQQALHASAREGARMAALPSATSADISARALDALDGIPLGGTPTVTITPSLTRPCEGRLGETVLVVVTVPTTIEIPVWGTESRTLTGRGEFRCE
jgi:Flp pilus assembly protein TadG